MKSFYNYQISPSVSAAHFLPLLTYETLKHTGGKKLLQTFIKLQISETGRQYMDLSIKPLPKMYGT
jgi:hypothetical protein